MPQSEPRGLVQKLAAIRREIPNIEKKGHNAHFNYDFMRAEDVAGNIGDALAARNVVLGKENLKVEIHQLEKGMLAIVTCDYVFVDGDTLERHVVASAGSGFDTNDKCVPKALTASLKYCLTHALCLRIGHMDAEEDSDASERPVTQSRGIRGDTNYREKGAEDLHQASVEASEQAAMNQLGDANDFASPQALNMLAKLVASKAGSDSPIRNVAWATDWIQRQCKELWGMTTTSDGKGGARLKERLQNRHVAELTRRITEDKDPGEEF